MILYLKSSVYTSVFVAWFWPGGSAVPGVYPADFLDIQGLWLLFMGRGAV